MTNFSFQKTVLAAVFFLGSLAAAAQEVKGPKTSEEWTRAYEPFRMAGNLYYVGTYDLGCYLITTDKGNILINTGLASSAVLIKKSIESLGFKFSDIKILLITQAHFDHVGALAAIRKMTGAKVMVDEKDAAVLASGGSTDYALGKYGRSFEPVKADRLLHDKDTITLGDAQLVLLHHPGHTKGSCSYLLSISDRQRKYKVLIANLPSIVTEKKFTEIPEYPGIAADYAYTLASMKNLAFDIWVASHAGQFRLHDKHKPGDAYNPTVFMGREDYLKALGELQKQYDQKMQESKK